MGGVTRTTPGEANTLLNYGYNGLGQRTSVSDNFGGSTTYGYTAATGQLASKAISSNGQLAASADRNFSHAVEGMLYAGLIRGSWYTMGRFGVGNYIGVMNRNVQLGVVASGLSSDSNGGYGVAYGESGYRFDLGGWQVTT